MVMWPVACCKQYTVKLVTLKITLINSTETTLLQYHEDLHEQSLGRVNVIIMLLSFMFQLTQNFVF
jgi:hypothetical protein